MRRSHQRLSLFSQASTTGSTQTSSEFVDEEFKVIPEIKSVSQFDKEDDNKLEIKGRKISIPPMTEDEMLGLVEALFIIPQIALPKIPTRDKEKLRPLARELKIYCDKKGYNARDIMFDELPLLLVSLQIGASYYTDYKVYYKDGKKEETVADKKLSADYEHQKKIDEQYNSDGTLKVQT